MEDSVRSQSESFGSIEIERMDRKYTKGRSASDQFSFIKLKRDSSLSLDETYQELKAKFGPETITKPTCKSWWEKISSGALSFTPPGSRDYYTKNLYNLLYAKGPLLV